MFTNINIKYYIILVIRDDGHLSEQTTIPDTITEWVGNSLCTHPVDGVGVTEMTGVTAFQPFFVSLTLPYSAIRGERLPILVTVFNYLENCITVNDLNINDILFVLNGLFFFFLLKASQSSNKSNILIVL